MTTICARCLRRHLWRAIYMGMATQWIDDHPGAQAPPALSRRLSREALAIARDYLAGEFLAEAAI